MWYDNLPESWPWHSLWYGYVRCQCNGVRTLKQPCSSCGYFDASPEPHAVYAGGEDSIEDYLFLDMIEREWRRDVVREDSFLSRSGASAKAGIVILFWTYFETKIERLIRAGLVGTREQIIEDMLSRYASVGGRMDRLYLVVFGSTYLKDLKLLGFESIAKMLQKVQRQRNLFIHGKPTAITDRLVEEVVASLKEEHESWVAVLNHCIRTQR